MKSAAWVDSWDALNHIIKVGAHRDILILGNDFPYIFDQPGVRVTFIGPIGGVLGLKCESALLMNCPDASGIPFILSSLAPKSLFSLVYVDSDHCADALVQQMAAFSPLCRVDAVWVFDDAVPPTAAMATREPCEGW